MESKLSKGIIPRLFTGQVKTGTPFVTQISSMKPMTGGQLRLKINDGEFENQYAMYSGKQNDDMKQNAIIRATKWEAGGMGTGNTAKHIITISMCDVLHKAEECGGKLGSPKPWKVGDSTPGGVANVKAPVAASGKENTKPQGGARLNAIQTLTPYMNKWTIKGRVTSKDREMRTWRNAKGEGNLFGFVIADATSDLKGTAFKEDADKWFPMIEKGKIFQISNGQLKAKNPRYNNTQHDYELTLGKMTTLEEVYGDDGDDTPTQIYDFKPLDKLSDIVLAKDATTGRGERKNVDICAVCQSAGDVSHIMIKSQGKELAKRELTLVDDSGRSIQCTMWGDDAVAFEEANVGSVIALKGASMGDYQGKSLSIGRDTDVAWNLREEKRAQQLKDWWANTGGTSTFESMSQGQSGAGGGRQSDWKNLGAINPHVVGAVPDNKPLYFNSKATITYISKEAPIYKGCAKTVNDRKCQKKVQDEGDGNYRCEKCNTSDNEFEYRIIMKASIADDTGTQYVTFFQDQGSQLLGMESQEFGRLFDDRDSRDKEYDQVMTAPLFKELVFNNRATVDNYQDEQRTRISVTRLADMDYAQHTNRMLEEIATYAK